MPSYEKNASSGLWSCRFRELGDDGIIHNKRLSGYKTKKLAQFAYEDYIKEQDEKKKQSATNTATAPDPNEITVAELCRKYLAFQKGRIRESSYLTAKNKIEVRIIPFFEEYSISRTTPSVVQSWLETLDSLSFKYKKDLFSYLSAVCSYGEDYYDTNDFMKKVRPPRNTERKKEMKVWSPEQFKAAMEFEENPQYKMLYIFLYFTGCRKGEALAISWNDIDLAKGTVKINKSVSNKTQDTVYAITPTKNESSNRTVTMPPVLIQQLKSYQSEYGDNQFVFGGDRPFMTEGIRRHLIKDALAANIEPIRIHDLRHSHASVLISAGAPITAISKRLGHSTVEQTLNTYSHMLPSDEYMLMQALSSDKINGAFL